MPQAAHEGVVAGRRAGARADRAVHVQLPRRGEVPAAVHLPEDGAQAVIQVPAGVPGGVPAVLGAAGAVEVGRVGRARAEFADHAVCKGPMLLERLTICRSDVPP
jgi:hypothetical protein